MLSMFKALYPVASTCLPKPTSSFLPVYDVKCKPSLALQVDIYCCLIAIRLAFAYGFLNILPSHFIVFVLIIIFAI